MGERIRERCWCGFIAMGGPIVEGRMIGMNIYLQPGAARFDVVDEKGKETRMSLAAIERRIKRRLKRLRVVTED